MTMDEQTKTGISDPEIERLREKIRQLTTGEAELRTSGFSSLKNERHLFY